MSIQNVFKSLFSTSPRRRPIRRRPAAFRPQFDVLEDRLALDGTLLTLTKFSQTASWSGEFPAGLAVASPQACVSSAVDLCDWVKVSVDLPEGVWAEHGGMLVTIKPRIFLANFFSLYIYAPGVDPVTGEPLSKSENGSSAGEQGVWVEDPVNGDYTVVVVPTGTLPFEPATYDGIVSFDRGLTVKRQEFNNGDDYTQKFVAFGLSSSLPAVELLPDLVANTPSDFHIETGTCVPGSLYICFGAPELRQQPSCYPEETAGLTSIPPDPEHHPLRCLRFNQGESNFGDGPLELHLYPGKGRPDPDHGVVHDLYQRVYRSDGSVSQQPVAKAIFHVSHGHFHGLGWHAALHKLLPNGKPGEIVATMKDKGACILDTVNARFGQRRDSPQTYGNSDPLPCSNASHQDPNDPTFPNENYIQSGISVGYADLYAWMIMDQYIDITNVPDGTYALVTKVALDDRLREKSTANNTAMACVKISGITATATPCKGNDILVGNGGVEFLGGDGHDLLIAGALASMLEGGVGEDILIGGMFNDSSQANLDAIMAERSGAASYDSRVANLRANLLADGKVTSNGGGDNLTGGSDALDLFFGSLVTEWQEGEVIVAV